MSVELKPNEVCENKDVLKWRRTKKIKKIKGTYLRRVIVGRKEFKSKNGQDCIYYGEWNKVRGKNSEPYGCGLLVTEDKVVLGRFINGRRDKLKRSITI